MEATLTAVATMIGAVVGAVFTYLGTRQRLLAEARNTERSRTEQAKRLTSRYRDPLVRAAFDLQSRLYNMSANQFLDRHLTAGTPAEQRYAAESTLYVFGQYLCWVEILRREVQFLDLGDVESNRRLRGHLESIGEILLADRADSSFRIFRAEQRAIGEVMITVGPNEARECIGYAAFVDRRVTNATFAQWFETLAADIAHLAEASGPVPPRLVELQHALIDLLDFLDPEHQRFAARHRNRVGVDP